MAATPASAAGDAPLPNDPDAATLDSAGAPGAARLRPAHLVVVFLGGTLGTAAREGLGLAIPASAGVPWAVLVANLAGAFLLGVLLEALVRRGAGRGIRRTLRLLLGTGFLGGFTTYSALATDTALLVGTGQGWLAAAYGLGTVLVGALVTVAGILLASQRHGATR